MKRVLTICLMALLIVPMVFAADDLVSQLNPEKNFMLEVVQDYDMPLTPRAKAMGGAGIAFPAVSDAFFMNPAGFASKVGVMLPSVDVTIYHPYDMLKPNKDGVSLIDSIQKAQEAGEEDALLGAVEPLLGMIKSGKGKLLDINASASMDILGVALGLNVNDSLHTFGIGLGGVDSSLFDELNVNANFGLGYRVHFGDSLWLDIGGNCRVAYKAFSTTVDAKKVVSQLQPPKEGEEPKNIGDYFLKEVPVAAGFAVPMDFGINFSGSWFSVGLVGRNINGTYNMKTFGSIEDFYPNWTDGFSGNDFKIKTPWSLDFGVGFRWDNAFFKPTFVCDIVDINGMFGVEKFDAREFMKHVKAGAEIRLLSCLDVRGGINQGYWSVGAGLDLAIVKVDVAYYWSEFGEKLGDYGLDALSVRVNIGFDR